MLKTFLILSILVLRFKLFAFKNDCQNFDNNIKVLDILELVLKKNDII